MAFVARHSAGMTRHFILIALVIAAASALGGCGSMNTWLADSLGDKVPQWAGGLPPDAPPREGAPGYAEYIEGVRSRALVDAPPPAGTPTVTPAVATAKPKPKASVAVGKPVIARPSIVSASPKAGTGTSIADQFIY
jgi:hypothetical protein